jgi:hypothetical protein
MSYMVSSNVQPEVGWPALEHIAWLRTTQLSKEAVSYTPLPVAAVELHGDQQGAGRVASMQQTASLMIRPPRLSKAAVDYQPLLVVAAKLMISSRI